MALRNPQSRIALVRLISLLADADRQRQDWVVGRPGWEPWADEFYDDYNDGVAALERGDGALVPHDAIGDTLRTREEADVLRPLVDLLELIHVDGGDRALPSREAATIALQHPRWPDVVRAAAAARAVLDDPLPDAPPHAAP